MSAGRPFFKMTGSGNDFVFVDAITEPAAELDSPESIQAVCGRGTGVGADGIVFLEPSRSALFRMRYLNSDGSTAAMCGNAALCATRLAVELARAPSAGFEFETESGLVAARIREGLPEVDLAPVTDISLDAGIELKPGERRIGYALVGVPHLIVLCDDLEGLDIQGRGRALRFDASLRSGANVNFIAQVPESRGRYRIRTYERGVEGETLACGTGAVAAAILAGGWTTDQDSIDLVTRSGRVLSASGHRSDSGAWLPSLRGEGRIVFEGRLRDFR